VKSESGRQRPEQRTWEERIVKAGGIYVLARSWADVAAAIVNENICSTNP